MVRVSDKLIRQMADDIVKEVAPEKVILFGSWARGDGGDESDVDFLVIEREAFGPHRSRRKEAARIWRCLSQYRVSKDILVYSSQDIQEGSKALHQVIAVALDEGKLLYESA